jgi:hypothetical protein
MPRAYFEPKSLDALAEVFAQAKRRLNPADINDPMTLEALASRILRLAADGHSPWLILREIVGQEDGNQGGTNGRIQEERNRSLNRTDQAVRARKLAGECVSPLVADLLEIHARCCEENASKLAAKIRPRRKSRGGR